MSTNHPTLLCHFYNRVIQDPQALRDQKYVLNFSPDSTRLFLLGKTLSAKTECYHSQGMNGGTGPKGDQGQEGNEGKKGDTGPKGEKGKPVLLGKIENYCSYV